MRNYQPNNAVAIYDCFASNAVVYFLPDLDEIELIPSSDFVQLVLLAWFKW